MPKIEISNHIPESKPSDMAHIAHYKDVTAEFTLNCIERKQILIVFYPLSELDADTILRDMIDRGLNVESEYLSVHALPIDFDRFKQRMVDELQWLTTSQKSI